MTNLIGFNSWPPRPATSSEEPLDYFPLSKSKFQNHMDLHIGFNSWQHIEFAPVPFDSCSSFFLIVPSACFF